MITEEFVLIDYNKKQWISVKEQPPRKDIPILVACEFQEMPDVVKWLEEGTYGEPGFFESNEEYQTKEEHILYWMPAPKHPFPYQAGQKNSES